MLVKFPRDSYVNPAHIASVQLHDPGSKWLEVTLVSGVKWTVECESHEKAMGLIHDIDFALEDAIEKAYVKGEKG